MVHLHVHSWHSLGAGASSPQALAQRAASLGQEALALTDDWSVAGAVQHATACQNLGLRPLHGARVLVGNLPLVLLAATGEGYANLCDILTLAHRIRLKPRLTLDDLRERSDGLFALADVRELLPGESPTAIRLAVQNLKALFGTRLFLERVHHWRCGDSRLVQQIDQLAEVAEVHTVATNAVRHATHQEYELYDALSCMRLRLQVSQGHAQRPSNEAAYLCDKSYFERLGTPLQALANSAAIARECDVQILSPHVVPPPADVPPGMSPDSFLRRLCIEGFKRRYPRGNSAAVRVLEHELRTISNLELDEFFLVVWEVTRFAKSFGIRCSGRGSAANSLVAYLLGITEVDPIQHHLLFERFLHEGRKGMPDIDVDFDTSRRGEVIAWMNRRWGEAHTAMTANTVTFRLRSAVREMCKILGYPEALINKATKLLPHGSVRRVREHRNEVAMALGESPAIDVLCRLVEKLDGCPRHLSLHSGGMILSRQPLRHLSPILTSRNGVRQVQFNKDDVERLGLIKFDVLGLRMLAVVSEAQYLIAATGESAADRTFDVDALPPQDEKAYRLIRSSRTLGLFQIESPGQWNLLARTQPETFDDLVVQVALFRPGPLQGNMVHPYVKRRRGASRVSYPHPCLEPVLRDTRGLILFQEQILEVAHVYAGMSLTEADEFRRLMSKFRDRCEMEAMRQRFVEGAIATHGVSQAHANSVFDVVSKFVGYGFCRSHAAAFARTVYQSAYLKAHYPSQYMAAVMEHKPGFFPEHTLLEEARRLGVEVRPPCLLRSSYKYTLEGRGPKAPIRVPLTQVKHLAPDLARLIVLERMLQPFESIEDAVLRLPLELDAWENLARSGALDAFGARRDVLYQVRGAIRVKPSGQQLQLDWKDAPEMRDTSGLGDAPRMPLLRAEEMTKWDFATMRLTTGQHPIMMKRPDLQRLGALPIEKLSYIKAGRRVLVGGAVISRQRPPTAKGFCFIILEDESGYVPTALNPQVYEAYQKTLRSNGLLLEGTLESGGDLGGNRYRSILVRRLWSLEEVTGSVYVGASGFPGESPRAGVGVS